MYLLCLLIKTFHIIVLKKLYKMKIYNDDNDEIIGKFLFEKNDLKNKKEIYIVHRTKERGNANY